jgi:carbon monoxide dehydrogenase subunit G
VADTSEASINVDASPAEIIAVIADFENYPQWAGSIRECTPIGRFDDGTGKEVRFVVDAGIVKDTYVNSYVWHGDSGVSWHMTEGKMQKSQEGSYTLEPAGAGTKVTYKLSVELAVPMIGMFKRKAEKMVMDTALKDLKKRVEALK